MRKKKRAALSSLRIASCRYRVDYEKIKASLAQTSKITVAENKMHDANTSMLRTREALMQSLDKLDRTKVRTCTHDMRILSFMLRINVIE